MQVHLVNNKTLIREIQELVNREPCERELRPSEFLSNHPFSAAKTEEGGVLCLIAKILLPCMRERDFCFCQELDISSHTFQEIEDNFVDITVVDKLLDA